MKMIQVPRAAFEAALDKAIALAKRPRKPRGPQLFVSEAARLEFAAKQSPNQGLVPGALTLAVEQRVAKIQKRDGTSYPAAFDTLVREDPGLVEAYAQKARGGKR